MMGWQPIETAPKDGAWVLLSGGAIFYGWNGDTDPPIVVGQYVVGDGSMPNAPDRWQFAWYDGGYYGEYENPTHWMPLPVPPAAKEPEAQLGWNELPDTGEFQP